MARNRLVGLGLAIAALGVAAQTPADPAWKESATPPPPAFDAKRLIPIEMPKYAALKFGVDPATLSITPDGVVRYVVVVISPAGTINAMYEGIRCATREVKTLARSTSSGNWSVVADPQWQGWADNLTSKHALAIAGQGLCEGRAPAAISVPGLIKALTPSQDRF